jgi:hypothetical protein
MLALAITVLFTLTGILACLMIADSLLKARAAYAQLLREAAVMRDGPAMQPAAPDLRLRAPVRRAMPDRRSAQLRMLRAPAPVPAYAAA